ncbi:penicillin-binding transpeptidase domain-containing protein [Caloramator sp. mosi_1]|uniref:transglycosylase domain-containing protein n=1 Tax=Caloramator sp. mosi_1 TaxID=3023090 RepID=UPI00235EC2B8|nr:penicillin-binding transpeptidase domain-containing protein [Caloramator sp. mosi_1]WDC83660.1 penicillin-binding transpeptidase domain-containing protein [Caloramator sp. mosi_1]
MDEKDAKQKLKNGGYKVYLTIDTRLQEKAQEIINNEKFYKNIPVKIDKQKLKENENAKPNPQAAAVIMDLNGEVRALIGGRGLSAGSFNYAAGENAKMPPGSSIKPLTVYTPAIENKIITPSTIINDSRDDEEAIEIYNATGKNWFPNNYDNKCVGPVTVRYALEQSKNTIATKILYRLGKDISFNYATKKFGLTTLVKDDKSYATLALGQLTYGARPIEMAAAYTAFANNGIISSPILYTKVEDRNGNVILEKEAVQRRAISQDTAFVMNQLLQSVVKNGLAKSADLGAMPTGGKTGTTEKIWMDGL